MFLQNIVEQTVREWEGNEIINYVPQLSFKRCCSPIDESDLVENTNDNEEHAVFGVFGRVYKLLCTCFKFRMPL